ncbi:MFS transporter [Rhodophyticola sp. CCM32]|uniref:MFS transporter n=1 Tax=Rhodophyticola sp. CCM32 TaxID=2916397 RepID=UPI00107F6F04|nr:MFS transporter [Rhodophyticola sp. CCM32]QBY01878.1 MFS transporter [Rhodophyticola sp. CCM32]
MKAGLAFLVLGYVLSQFYRAFLAVLAPVLGAEIGATPEDLARASGLWFAAFALMQIPVGWALDTIGPRLTASVLFAVGGAGGAAVFALAQDPETLQIAMALIGIGCSPVLMASYYIFARVYPPAMFATLAGVTVGVSSLGNIASALPMAVAIDAFGWRETVMAMAVLTLGIALGMALLVQDPAKPEGEPKGSLLDILRIPGLWPILAMMLVCYAPAAGIRGLWVAPFLTDIHGATLAQIGTVTLLMGLAMAAGSLTYAPLDRLLGTRKWVVLGGNLVVAICCLTFWMAPMAPYGMAILLVTMTGLFGASYAVVIAHGRSFLPGHLTGRGVTLLNLFGMGGAGVMQFASGPYFARLSASHAPPQAFGTLFGVFGAAVLLGCAVYIFSRDRAD